MKKEKKKLKLFQVQFLPDAGYSIPQKKKKKKKKVNMKFWLHFQKNWAETS